MRKEAAWLLRELPELIAKGVLDDTTATRLRQHYAQSAADQSPGWGMILLAIGGAGLIGLGIILIFAHNWENWTPEIRVFLSLLPLLIGQAAVGYALRTRSRIWCEGAGLFTALTIGASIALIAQTYQFGGDLPRFYLMWTLLALPLVYLLDASAVAVLCWLGTLGWAMANTNIGFASSSDSPQFALLLLKFLLIASLPLPHLIKHLRMNPGGTRVAWMLRVALLTVVVGVAAVLSSEGSGSLYIVYTGLAAVALLAGRYYFSGLQGMWGNPLLGFGRLGVFAIVLLGTTTPLWQDLIRLPDGPLLVFPCLLSLLAVWLARQLMRNESPELAILLAALTPFIIVLAGIGEYHFDLAVILGNIYALTLAAMFIRTGLHGNDLNLANEGAALIAAVALLRFFDSDLSYVARGVGFIVTGAGFFASVWWLRRRMRVASA